MFLTNRDEFVSMCPKTSKPTYKMTNFYINQRKKLNILMDNGHNDGEFLHNEEKSDSAKNLSVLRRKVERFSNRKVNRCILHSAIVPKIFPQNSTVGTVQSSPFVRV